jgi:hypothetical protein
MRQLLPPPPARPAALALALAALALVFIAFAGGADWRDALPRRIEKGGLVKPSDLAPTYTYWTLLAAAATLILLATTTAAWAGRPQPLNQPSPPHQQASTRRRTLAIALSLFAILALATTLRAPRLSQSLYNDEIHSARLHTVGEWKDRGPGRGFEFRQPPWSETVWGNTTANNHIPLSIAARALHDARSRAVDAAPGELFEAMLRLPSLVAGLSSILAIAALAAALGGPRAALIAALIAAAHPWHVRFSTEARGYSLVLLFAPLLLYAAILIYRRDSARAHALFALSAFFLLWTTIGTIYFLVATGLALSLALLFARPSRPRTLLRFCVSCTLAATAFFIAFSPCLPQVHAALFSDDPIAGLLGDLSPAWAKGLASSYLLGMAHSPALPDSTTLASWQTMAARWGTFSATIAAAAASLLFVGGLVALGRARRGGALVAVASLAAAALAIVQALRSGLFLHHWYLLYILPSLIVGAALFAASRRRLFAWPALAATALTLALAYPFPLSRYLVAGKSSARDAVELARSSVWSSASPDQENSPPLAAFFCHADAYYPFLAIPATPKHESLLDLAAEAHAKGQRLHVIFSYRDSLALRHAPEAVALLESSPHFEHLATLDSATDADHAHHIFRSIPPDP